MLDRGGVELTEKGNSKGHDKKKNRNSEGEGGLTILEFRGPWGTAFLNFRRQGAGGGVQNIEAVHGWVWIF